MGAFGANRTEKVGTFRANKIQKSVCVGGGGGFTAAHTRTVFNIGVLKGVLSYNMLRRHWATFSPRPKQFKNVARTGSK